MPGVNIEWAHRDARGAVDRAASQRAAEQMVRTYGMKHQAALVSRHTQGRGVDMSISWSSNLEIEDARGRRVVIRTTPRNGTNPQLWAVGRTYGVVKLPSDAPHWSDDGH
jgi:hypothetical protein